MKAIVVLSLLLAGCQQSSIPPAPVAPAGKVELVSLSCDPANHFGLIEGVIRNSGDVPLEFLNVFLRVSGQVHSVPVLDLQMPVGSMGKFTYSTGKPEHVSDCAVVSVQDQQGNALL